MTPPTILLIEDDIALAKMYKIKLNIDGYEVVVARNGEDALKIALGDRVDFILLDIMIPKVSGIDFLQILRQDPKGKNIPVLVLSNLTDQKEADKAYKFGVKEYLVKAMFTPEQVIEKIKKYLPLLHQ
jgi:DNA-binding response OmpR family regulator